MTQSEKAVAYFQENPKARDGVWKAYFAYHAKHFRLEPKGHNFLGTLRESKCAWCGRSRELVRWDDLAAHCLQRPEEMDMETVIKTEEEKAFDLQRKAMRIVPAVIKKMGLDGKTLAFLHHTHGFDPETVASVVTVSEKVLSEYYVAMEVERERSRQSKKTIEIRVTL